MFWAVNHGSSGRIQSLIDTVRTRQLHARTQAVKCLSGWPPQRHAQHHPRRPPCVPSTLRCTRSFATLVSSVERQHIPHAKRRAPLGHSTNDPAERPARSDTCGDRASADGEVLHQRGRQLVAEKADQPRPSASQRADHAPLMRLLQQRPGVATSSPCSACIA